MSKNKPKQTRDWWVLLDDYDYILNVMDYPRQYQDKNFVMAQIRIPIDVVERSIIGKRYIDIVQNQDY